MLLLNKLLNILVGAKQILFFLIFFITFIFFGYSQSVVLNGTVTDSLNNALYNANILVRNTKESSKIQFTTTDKEGKFSFSIKSNTNYSIELSYLGYSTYKTDLTIQNQDIHKQFVLYKSTEKLKGVFIQTKRAIEIKKDTVHYNVEHFLKGSERNVEDLLKNLPGVDVSLDGKILVEGIEIKKLMVNNEDFVGEKYRLVSKNLRSETIESVEVIDKYLENKLLEDIVDSEDKVINLNLKDEYAHTVFGNIDLGYDIFGESYHRFQSNIMSMGGKTKYYLLGNSNNTGNGSGAQNITINMASGFNPNINSIAEGNYLSPYFYFNNVSYDLFSKRYTNRTTHITSFNTITNFGNNIKWTNNLSLNKNKSHVNKGTVTKYRDDIDVTKTQKNISLSKEYMTSLESRLQVDISAKQNVDIKANLHYKNADGKYENILNQLSFTEVVYLKNKTYNITANYVYKLNKKSIWAINSKLASISQPEQYANNDFIYNDLFTELNGDKIHQNLKNNLQIKAINSIFATKMSNRFSYDIKAEFTETKESLFNSVYLVNGNEYKEVFNFKNKHKFTKQDAQIKAHANYKKDNFKFSISVDGHYINSLFNTELNNNRYEFSYIQPNLGINYISDNDKSEVSIGYSKIFSDTPSNYLHKNFFLMNSQFITKGYDKHAFMARESYRVNYKYGKVTDLIRIRTGAEYNNNKASFTTRSIIRPNYSYVENIIGKGGYEWNLNSYLDYYVEPLATNFSLGIRHSQAKSSRAVNTSDFEDIYNRNWDYSLDIQSIFASKFNYKLTSNLNRNHYNSKNSIDKNWSTYLRTNLELQFLLNSKFNLNLNFENNNYFNNAIKSTQFVDSGLNYKTDLFNKNFHFSLEGKNLLNKKTFNQLQVNDFYTSESTTYLLPRMLLLSVNFGF